ncbi:MAG TPA: histidine kinase [Pyrinomonadaceae bacterium]|nr:histidine kinase [Pyrinomonadaceae bacterium]
MSPNEQNNSVDKTSFFRSAAGKAAVIFGGWTLLALFFSFQAYLNYAYVGRPQSLGWILTAWLSCVYIWAPLTPAVIKLAQRFPLERGKIRRALIVHLIAATVISTVQIAIYIFVRQALMGDAPQPFSPVRSFQNWFVAEFHINVLLYCTIVGLTQAYDYYRRYRERERRAAQLEIAAAQLETQLAHAQLDALKMQIHPHFLFNTLNTISVLMQEDVAAANKMLLRLSELLRAALKSERSQEVSLRQELEFLRGYLEIEQTRFHDRLHVDFDVDAETLDSLVPNLILQPLVENAIKHGIAPRAEAGTIRVRAQRENGRVRLSVRDDGAGLNEAKSQSSGIGLANTRARLEKLYGAQHSFEIISPAAPTGGLEVKVTIPFRSAAAAAQN